MKYISISQPTAEWLLSHTELRKAVHDIITNPLIMGSLSKGDISDGPLRIATDAEGTVLAVWNAEYVSGT